MVEGHASSEELGATHGVVQRVEQRIGSFLHSRLPGPKTEKAMKVYDALSARLPMFGQEATQKLRPIVKAGAYASNCVGTYYEAMLVASLAGGVVLLGKEALKVVPETGKRKGFGGAISGLHLKTVPRSFGSALRTEAENVDHNPSQWLRNALRGKPTGTWREAQKEPVIQPTIEPPPSTITPEAVKPLPVDEEVPDEQALRTAIVKLNSAFDLPLYNATQSARIPDDGAQAFDRVLGVDKLPADLDFWDRPKDFPKDYDAEDLGKLNGMLEGFIAGSNPDALRQTYGDVNIDPEQIASWIKGGGSSYFTEEALKDPRIQYLKTTREVCLFLKYMRDHLIDRGIENPDLGELIGSQEVMRDWTKSGEDYRALGNLANHTIHLVRKVLENPLIQTLMQPKDSEKKA